MRFITLDKNKIVISIRYGTEGVCNEIISEHGELGQQMLEDGTFIDIEEDTNSNNEITMEDKINYIYYKLQGGIL
ncbi:hypothetical protein [Clostridium senegalense]|uniref:hypothetical protein n=1 Tax=Clostridium senegalense TaxID=1465809 RepID=UPI00028840EE|nr:hypothetical protein [Clostridium senegalense]